MVARLLAHPLPIRIRMALWYALSMGLLLLLFNGALYGLLIRGMLWEIDRSLAFEARQVALRLQVMDRHDALQDRWLLPHTGRFVIRSSFIEVRSEVGEVLWRSDNLGGESIPQPSPDPGKPGFGQVHIEGKVLRTYTLSPVRLERADGSVVVARSLDSVRSFKERLRWMMVLGTGFLLFATAGIGSMVAGRALRPLERIARTIREITAGSDFSARVESNIPSDEVGQLALAFNRMLDRIETAYAQKENAYRQAKAAYEAQRRFAADASHELRTPLTVLQANLELLRSADPGGPSISERSEALADMEAEVRRMSNLVRNLLALARADAGETLQKHDVDVDRLAGDLLRRVRPMSGKRRIDYHSAVPGTCLWADGEGLRQLLANLLENAVKYTDEDGHIAVSVRETDAEVVLTVEDDGVGIDPGDLPHIFERFYRSPEARALDGSGLGLAIAVWVVEQHEGSIEVDSEPGVGSRFIVRLPRKDPGK